MCVNQFSTHQDQHANGHTKHKTFFTTRRTRGPCGKRRAQRVRVGSCVCVKLKRVDAIQRSARAACAPADSYMYRLYLVLRACVWNVTCEFDIYIYMWTSVERVRMHFCGRAVTRIALKVSMIGWFSQQKFIRVHFAQCVRMIRMLRPPVA